MTQRGRLCRLLEAHKHPQRVEAEAAALQLLEATDLARRKRAADGSWRPPQGAGPAKSGADAPDQAVLRLHSLYSSADPPPVLIIRHPQVTGSGFFSQSLLTSTA